MDNLGIGSGTVLCQGYGMLVWPVMADCVAWLQLVLWLISRLLRGLFCGHLLCHSWCGGSKCHCLSLNNMFGGNC